MNDWIDLTGKSMGFWTVEGPASKADGKKSHWWCVCQCGNRREVIGSNLRSGRSISCGCYRLDVTTRHGMCGHPAYVSWQASKKRCYDKNFWEFHNYGGRGIAVCDRWRKNFALFWEDMGPTWYPGATLHRIDSDGGYEPANCRWATPEEQANNRRYHVMIDTPHGRMNVMQAAKLFGLRHATVLHRHRAGWPMEEMFRPTSFSKKKATLDNSLKNGAPTKSMAQSFTIQQLEKAFMASVIGRFPNYTFREGGLPMQEVRDVLRDIEARLVSEDLASDAD